MVDPDSARALRPLRQFTMPGRTLLRAGLIAALLGLAAAVLHTPAGCPPIAVPSDAPSKADDTARPVDEGRSADATRTGVPDTQRSATEPDQRPQNPPAHTPTPPDQAPTLTGQAPSPPDQAPT
ncbi:hypothetical protein ACLQ3B_06965 [Micromonospora sp. DT53]|uniref:hypothetical protein n=1 Tax=Micromonospora sp. DT53 TaxID=3393444 RepID=UPI003CF58D30